jgi:hypothetical protein
LGQRARAREPCNIAVALTPLDVEFCSNGTVNLKSASSIVEQSRNIADAFVNLLARAFAVSMSLAGADHGLFICVIHKIQTLAKLNR